MPIQMNMPHANVPENGETERKLAAIRTALFLLAFSQVIPVSHYLWQTYCC
ncbi:hypothetical protein SAMN05216386_3027 [Nitrosospira briensis]|uniref:Uncharacterized protein n=1 Tax=Nitrosospira briensis TaxID=35799 RepID=A0A1I5FIG9_9PROT|nr:hypothetical protein SAMN05216386_3027 [Nitrosospira briensis]